MAIIHFGSYVSRCGPLEATSGERDGDGKMPQFMLKSDVLDVWWQVMILGIILAAIGVESAAAAETELSAKPSLSIHAHTAGVTQLQFTSDGKQIYSFGWDGCVRLWDVPGGNKASEIRLGYYGSKVIAISPDGKKLVAPFAERGRERPLFAPLESELKLPPDNIPFQVIDPLKKGKPVVLDEHFHGEQLQPVTFSQDSSRLMCYSLNQIVVWDFKSGKKTVPDLAKAGLAAHDGNPARLVSSTISPDGKKLAFFVRHGDNWGNKECGIWNIDGDAKYRALFKNGLFPFQMQFHPDGSTVLVACFDGCVAWDVSTGKAVRKFALQPEPVERSNVKPEKIPVGCRLSFDAKGDKLLILTFFRQPEPSKNGSQATPLPVEAIPPEARIWDFASGKQLNQIEIPADTISAALSPDGKLVALGTKGNYEIQGKATERIPPSKWTGLIKILSLKK
ncbi:WD40 repeat domain-containing protein [Zavarzinella formosa]|uniref:WD40 repeat domain-containing protein n=1 Tax=Zavarzinella formosa TaxID=360055 RepID=UPI0012F9A37E|nr:WD40 repeat domain-containing protein [Zavarzinella formosa]